MISQLFTSNRALRALVLTAALIAASWTGPAPAQTTTAPNGKFATPFTIGAAGTGGQAVSILPGMTAVLTNKGATATAGEPSAPGGIGRTIWLQWTPTVTGDARITVASSTLDPNRFRPALSIFTGNSTATLVAVTQDIAPAGRYNASVLFTATAGTTYRVQVDGIFNTQPPYLNEGPFTIAAGIGLAAPKPSEGFQPQSGWWYNANVPGIAFPMEFRNVSPLLTGPAFMGTPLLYDPGPPFGARWYLMQGQTRADDGAFGYGSLATPDGPLTFLDFANGRAFDQPHVAPILVGNAATNLRLVFDTALTGTMSYSALGVNPSFAIRRYPIQGATVPVTSTTTTGGGSTTPAVVPETGWWWTKGESGRAVFVEVQNDAMMIGILSYSDDQGSVGRATWAVTSNKVTSPASYTGRLLAFAAGPSLATAGAANPPIPAVSRDLGQIDVTFTSTTAGKIVYGRSNKAFTIERFKF